MSPDEQARVFYVAFMAGKNGPAVLRLFQPWWNASAENRRAFRKVQKAWRAKTLLEGAGEADEEDIPEEFAQRQWPLTAAPGHDSVEPPRVARRVLGTFAVLTGWGLLGAGLTKVVPLMRRPTVRQIAWSDAENKRNELPRTEQLPEGSTMRLAADTALRWRMTDSRREFELKRGRVLFTVEKDPHRPFDVQAGATSVVAVGTTFSVGLEKRGEHDEVWAHVGHGEVMVKPGPAAPVQRLRTGQAARIEGGEMHIEGDVSPADTRLRWTGDVFEFKQVALQEAVAAFNEHNEQQLQIVDAPLASVEIGGFYKGHDPKAFAHALEQAGIVRIVKGSNPHSAIIRLKAPAPSAQSAWSGRGKSNPR